MTYAMTRDTTDATTDATTDDTTDDTTGMRTLPTPLRVGSVTDKRTFRNFKNE
jgi:hypothetical protein